MPTLLALGGAAITPLLLTGCQSNAQQDLIARELRTQEDQLYAMEDYLSQYQELVCKYRSENAALRRQLKDDYYDAGEPMPAPRTTPRTRRDGPSIESPATPRRNETMPPLREGEFDVPEVPPLEGSTSDDENLRVKANAVIPAPYENAAEDFRLGASGEAAPATGRYAVDQQPHLEAPNHSEPPQHDEPADDRQRPERIWLHGDVVANEAGGGPRLAVDVEPLDMSGRRLPFDGPLSLMLLERKSGGDPRTLARWDFTAAEAQSALDTTAGGQTMRFYLELPPDTPVADTAQIWVRVIPPEGTKLLAYADVNLQQPGNFSSRLENVFPESIPARITSRLIEGDWTTARPGEPANLPAKTGDSASEWRASTEVIPPVVVDTKPPAKRARPVVQQAAHSELARSSPPPVYTPPTWSPDRPRAAAAESKRGSSQNASLARQPMWSATR